MRFAPERLAQFVDALMAAFSTAELRTLLVRRFGIDLGDVAEPGVRIARFQSTAGHFNRANEIERLVSAARDERPHDQAFRAFADDIIEPPIQGLAELERHLADQVPYINPVQWRSRLEEAEAATCAITLTAAGKVGGGTGFLVAADRVLTAAHVLQPVIDTLQKKNGAADDPEKVRFRFDYKNLRDGKTLSFGVTYRLHRQWLMAYDPAVALDFALVRLDAPAGEHAIGTDTLPAENAARRGSIALPQGEVAYPADTPLQILHHPMGDELKLAIEMQSIVNVEPNPPRLYHRTNTDGGSSGAPCFDIEWNLIALHRGTKQGGYNQAVPIAPIVAALRKANVLEGAA